MRLRDWQTRLAKLITERRRAPFAWGSNDCCLFAADAVLAVTGDDHAQAWRGTYSSALEARRRLREAGGVAAIADAVLPRHPSPKYAAAGDVGLVALDEEREALAVCGGPVWLVPAEPHGLAVCPRSAAEVAWKVG